MVAIYLTRRLTNRTLSEIGREFGVRAPWAGQAAARIGQDQGRALKRRLTAIEKELGA